MGSFKGILKGVEFKPVPTALDLHTPQMQGAEKGVTCAKHSDHSGPVLRPGPRVPGFQFMTLSNPWPSPPLSAPRLSFNACVQTCGHSRVSPWREGGGERFKP